ncbi:MAG: cell division protein SepF [Armatimonadota bacterium]
MNQTNLPEYGEEEPRGIWGKIKDKLGMGDYYEEEEYYQEEDNRKKPVVKLQQTRINRVSIWHSIQTFDDAQMAADGLKDGRQQIVNLEKASPEISKRVVDFLYGVCYALCGYVEKIADKVYLFTPRNYEIAVENSEKGKKVQSPFFEN